MTEATLDVVVPLWNEEEVVPSLLEKLETVFSEEELRRSRLRAVRFILVDDGSTDDTSRLVARAIEDGLPATLYRLSRNFGHQCAVSAGLSASTADYVVVLDADLQDPPELIPAMLEEARRGFDVVYGRRRRRKENPLKRLGYWAFYRAVAALSDIPIPLDSGDFSLMTRRVVEALQELPETLRFPRVLRAWVGFRHTGLDFDRPGRAAGRSKYTLSRLYRLATDGLAAASIRPLQAAQVFSVGYVTLIAVIGVALLLVPREMLEGNTTGLLAAGFLLLLMGNLIQVFCIYILGAYVGRTYLEVKRRPPYIVMEVVGAPAEDAGSAGKDG